MEKHSSAFSRSVIALSVIAVGSIAAAGFALWNRGDESSVLAASSDRRGADEHAGHDHDHDHESDEAHEHGHAAGEEHIDHGDADHDPGEAAHEGPDVLKAAEGHAEPEHEHDESAAIELTPQALKNIGYKPFKIVSSAFDRTISLPGMVVERPGKTQLHVAAPLGGVVTRVRIIQGEAIEEARPLFDIRLTHEELVAAQGEFLRTTEELDVVNREITRLEAITEGVVAGSRLRDQKYGRQKLEANLRAQRQALLLHGLSETNVEDIVRTRQLLQSLTINAPQHQDDANCADDHLFHVQSISVQPGQQVEAGGPLAVLADHCELYIEGTSFEEDADHVRKAMAENANISADLVVRDRPEGSIDGLKILYIADQIDRESRVMHFYVPLPNSILVDRTEGERRFMQWRFKPGQRVELRLPVERWKERLVLPASAVVDQGAEAYVFLKEGTGHFHRTPVHVLYRDQRSVVVDNDGSVHAGDTIAGQGAFQMHLDLKNKAGGGIDPHAGHNH